MSAGDLESRERGISSGGSTTNAGVGVGGPETTGGFRDQDCPGLGGCRLGWFGQMVSYLGKFRDV
jgi:hypothetical protein